MDRFADAFRAELTAFTEVVAGTRTSPCTVADARRSRADRGGRHGAPSASTAPFDSRRFR